MKANEFLKEAGIGDALKAIAKDPTLLANPKNIPAAANRIEGNRAVQDFTQQLVKVWQNVLDQEQDKMQRAGTAGKISDQEYERLLKGFISKTVMGGGQTNAALDRIITGITTASNRGQTQLVNNLFQDLVSQGLMIRAMSSATAQSQNQNSAPNAQPQNNQPPLRSVAQVKDALGDARIRDAEINQMKAAISAMGIKDPIRTSDPTAKALLQTLGIPVT